VEAVDNSADEDRQGLPAIEFRFSFVMVVIAARKPRVYTGHVVLLLEGVERNSRAQRYLPTAGPSPLLGIGVPALGVIEVELRLGDVGLGGDRCHDRRSLIERLVHRRGNLQEAPARAGEGWAH